MEEVDELGRVEQVHRIKGLTCDANVEMARFVLWTYGDSVASIDVGWNSWNDCKTCIRT